MWMLLLGIQGHSSTAWGTLCKSLKTLKPNIIKGLQDHSFTTKFLWDKNRSHWATFYILYLVIYSPFLSILWLLLCGDSWPRSWTTAKKLVILLMQNHKLIDYMNREGISDSQRIGNCSLENDRFCFFVFLLLQFTGEKTEAKRSSEIID